MELNRNLRSLSRNLVPLKKEFFIEMFFYSFMFILLLIISQRNLLIFHSAVETFNSLVSFGVFIISLHTYSINKSDFLVFFGIGYFFVGCINIIHAFTYAGISAVFPLGDMNVATQLAVTTRYLAAITCLGSIILFYKPMQKFKIQVAFAVYFVILVVILLLIFYYRVFPTTFVNGQGLTNFKVVSDYVIAVLLLFAGVFYFRLRDNMDFQYFFFMECYLMLTIISSIIFTNYYSRYDWASIIAHILQATAYYSIYKGVIRAALKRPYDILFHRIDKVDRDLQTANQLLKEESNQRMNMEEILIKNQQCYDLIINNSSDAIIIQSGGKFIFANATAGNLLGTKNTHDLVGREVIEYIHQDYRNEFIERTRTAMKNKNKLPIAETKIFRLDGKLIDIEVTSCYIIYRGKPALLNMIKDITPQKKIEVLQNDIKENQRELSETKEYNRVLTEFFSNISHELKTPLNVLLGAIQVLMLPHREQLPRSFEIKLNRHFTTMKQNCYRLLRLVNNLIDLSKFDSGYLKLNLRNYNIVSVIEDITLSVADYVKNKGVEIVFDTNIEDKEMAVDGDKIERIMLNLLSNATKFTNEGGQITVNLEVWEESIIISVKDTGIGIPEDKLNLIFDRFGQVDKSLTRNREGSGIGLSLVKTLVEMHGGNISVSSKLGEGTEFILELPLKIVEEEILEDSYMYQSNVERISIEFSDIYSYS
jgi:PAS domain S-box-containing protein